MDKFLELKRAVETVEIVDTHAHNIVALDSNLPFISCFSEAKEEDETIDFKVYFSSYYIPLGKFDFMIVQMFYENSVKK